MTVECSSLTNGFQRAGVQQPLTSVAVVAERAAFFGSMDLLLGFSGSTNGGSAAFWVGRLDTGVCSEGRENSNANATITIPIAAQTANRRTLPSKIRRQ
jgi:hypothetical protein